MAKSHDVSILQPYCALKGLSVCKEDIHYALDHKYFYQPWSVYSTANVCHFDVNISRVLLFFSLFNNL